MKKSFGSNNSLMLALMALLIGAAIACQPTTTTPPLLLTPTPTAAPTPSPSVQLTKTQVKYALIENYGGVFFCDPDFYPVAREGAEEENAREQFPLIQQDAEKFAAILEATGIQESETYTDTQVLQVYRESKTLNALTVEASGDGFTFELRIGEDSGFRVTGTADSGGRVIDETREESFNTCPICLPDYALIDTPAGPMSVADLKIGDAIWTADAHGNRVADFVERTGRTGVQAGHVLIAITLADGRTVEASPGHPLADGRRFADVQVGDIVDGSRVAAVAEVTYSGKATYDVLPGGDTGLYWADGVLIGSTLSR
jgi:hypothetical protein